jgi:hypothetical protein
MTKPASSVSAVVERLYIEALVLSDEEGMAFWANGAENTPLHHDRSLALACERTRTIMILKDAVRWLASRRSSRASTMPSRGDACALALKSCSSPADEAWLMLLPARTSSFVRAVERFYERLLWLEGAMTTQHAAVELPVTGETVVNLCEWRTGRTRELARA